MAEKSESVSEPELADPTDLYGKFTIGGGEMRAYGPSSAGEQRCWLVVFERDEEIVHTEKVQMLYEPVFGYDAGDITALDLRIEEIIEELGLE